MNTDSILRSYYNVSSSMFVPFAVAEAAALASDLLSGETQGFAIDATTYDEATDEVYVGGPVGGTVAVIDTGTPANDLDDVALDASNLAQSGTSPKMVHFPDSPYVRWSPHNYCLQSQDLSTTWTNLNSSETVNSTTAPDGTATADTCTEDSANGRHGMQQTIAGFAQTTRITGSVYVKKKDRQYAWFLLCDGGGTNLYMMVVDLDNSAAITSSDTGGTPAVTTSVTSVGSGWFRLSISITPAADNWFLLFGNSNSATPTLDANHCPTYAGDNTSGTYWWGGQVNKGNIATPYLATTSAAHMGIPQSYDVAASQYGIWVEPAAVNLLNRSEELGSAADWTPVINGSVTANNTTAPDGSSTADLFTLTSDDGYINHPLGSLSGSTNYTWSIYAKRSSGSNYVELIISDDATTDIRGWYNLNTGVKGSKTTVGGAATAVAHEMVSIGNGWYRCSLSGSMSATPNIVRVLPTDADSSSANGSSGDAQWYWGGQFETGTIATSYIPTLGASVTRAIDNISAAVSTIPYSQTEGTVYVDAKFMSLGVNAIVFSEDASNNVLLTISGGNHCYFVTDGGVNQTFTSIGAATLNAREQLTFAWKANLMAGSLNGASAFDDTSGTIPNAVTSVTFVDAPPILIYRIVHVPSQIEEDAKTVETWRYNF